MDEEVLRSDRSISIRGTPTDPCLIAVRSAAGIWISDHAGRRYMDLYGNNCHHIGYGHPRLLDALQQQIGILSFVPRGLTNQPAVAFAERLAALVAWPDAKVVSARSGADAIEIALALARANTGRYKTISFYGSYHGRSAGALSLGGRHQDQLGLGPLLPGAIHIPPYYPLHIDGLDDSREACGRRSLEAMRFVFEHEPDIAAVFGESIRNGAYVPPDWYWPEVRRLCDFYGAVLCLDEIATGLGKTGSLFNYRRFDIRPDILVLGKALGGAVLPLSAVVADGRFDSKPTLNIGYFTHDKNPLCARAGDATLAIIEAERLVDNARTLGGHLQARLDELQARHPSIKGVRGAGLMATLDFDSGSGSAEMLAESIYRACIDRGLLLMLPRGRSLTISAPLIISRGELNDAIDLFSEAIGTL
jgi:4-aminobutyrate aminotransferase